MRFLKLENIYVKKYMLFTKSKVYFTNFESESEYWLLKSVFSLQGPISLISNIFISVLYRFSDIIFKTAETHKPHTYNKWQFYVG